MGGAIWSAAGRFFEFAVGLAAVALIARWVGPAAYGVFALSYVVVGLVEILVSDGPGDALAQRRELRGGHCNATLAGALAAALAAWAVIAVGAGGIARWLGGGEALAEILPLRAATLPLAALAVVPAALLLREQRLKALAGAGATAGALASLVGIGAAWWGAGLWSLVAMELARHLVRTVLVLRLARWRPGVRASRRDAVDLLGYNASTWGAFGLAYANVQLPRLLIASALGTEALGLYALAERVYDQVFSVLMAPMYQVLMPGIARVQADREAARQLAASMMRVAASVASPLYLGLAAVAGLLVPLVFGQAWAAAVPIVQLMMLLGLRSSMSIVQLSVVRGMGRPNWHLGANAVALALTVVLVNAALPYGLLAVTAAIVVRSVLMWLPYAWFVRQLTGLTAWQQGRAVSGPAFAALGMAAVTAGYVAWLGTSIPAAAALAAAVLLGMTVYYSLLPLFAPDAAAFARSVIGMLVRRDVDSVRRLFASG
ncbi:MAG: oligosaccharide flippase family protein [Burkholderiaceae bacterium]|nr:oligosaccharide flippase family protein [Burkholderiaceae bacterium]